MFDRPDEAAKAPVPKARRGRRISWDELYKIRPDLKPDNDNPPAPEAVQAAKNERAA